MLQPFYDRLLYKDYLIKQLDGLDCDVILLLRHITCTVGKRRIASAPPIELLSDTYDPFVYNDIVYRVCNAYIDCPIRELELDQCQKYSISGDVVFLYKKESNMMWVKIDCLLSNIKTLTMNQNMDDYVYNYACYDKHVTMMCE